MKSTTSRSAVAARFRTLPANPAIIVTHFAYERIICHSPVHAARIAQFFARSAKRIWTAPKVVRVGLENAVSVASVLLLTEATLTEVPEKERRGIPAEAGMESWGRARFEQEKAIHAERRFADAFIFLQKEIR